MLQTLIHFIQLPQRFGLTVLRVWYVSDVSAVRGAAVMSNATPFIISLIVLAYRQVPVYQVTARLELNASEMRLLRELKKR